MIKAKKFVGMNVTTLRNGKDLGVYLGAALLTAGLMVGTFNFLHTLAMRWWQKRQMKKMMASMEASMNADGNANLEAA